jgi:hypothetical protein
VSGGPEGAPLRCPPGRVVDIGNGSACPDTAIMNRSTTEVNTGNRVAPVFLTTVGGSWGLTLLFAQHILFPTATKRKDSAVVSLVRRGGKTRLKKDKGWRPTK